jgi:hypothetical protein
VPIYSPSSRRPIPKVLEDAVAAQGRRNVLIEFGLVRLPHRITRFLAVIASTVTVLVLLAGNAFGQVEITPLPTESPSSELAPGTQWVYWMAIGATVIVVLVLLVVAAGYLRFAPKFFGREETPAAVPPGTRPPGLVRQAAQIRYTPPPATGQAAAPAQAEARTATATAVAARPAPSQAAASAGPAADGPAAAEPASDEPAATATAQTTAPPSGEPAAQADAVGQAEVAAPEERPSAKAAEEVGATSAQPAPAAAVAASPSGGAELDQETFDRVLKEQLDRGVDRRVAEGRARAAAVVAARKKSQA